MWERHVKKSIKSVISFAFSHNEFQENATVSIVFFIAPLFHLFFPQAKAC